MKKTIYILGIILGILFSSCDDWLTVQPETVAVGENMYTTNDGVQQALNGVYILLRTSVYAPEGIMGGTGLAESLTSTWTVSSGSNSYYLSTHEYNMDDAAMASLFDGVFKNFYTIVANLNPLIEGLEANKGVLDEATYNVVKGEALAIRACIHLDLIRFWGPMPSKVDGSKAYLPYVKINSTDKYTYLTFDRYMEELFADLDEAELLLGKSDPILTYSADNTLQGSSKWVKRKCYFNYYGVLGLQTRALLWYGNKEEALTYARKVIDAVNVEDGTPKFRLANNSDFANLGDGMWDGTFYSEHLCGVSAEEYDYQKGAFGATNQVAYMDRNYTFVSELFGNNYQDLRYVNQWTWNYANMAFGYPPRYRVIVPRKYNGIYPSSNSGIQNMPVVRLAEMYLTIMECGTLAQANEMYEHFCESRNITYVPYTDADRDERVLMEYIREFMAESQNFFTYKRKAVKRMLWQPAESSDCDVEQYVLPIPPKEF